MTRMRPQKGLFVSKGVRHLVQKLQAFDGQSFAVKDALLALVGEIEALRKENVELRKVVAQHAAVFNGHGHWGNVRKGDGEYHSTGVQTDGPNDGSFGYGCTQSVSMKSPDDEPDIDDANVEDQHDEDDEDFDGAQYGSMHDECEGIEAPTKESPVVTTRWTDLDVVMRALDAAVVPFQIVEHSKKRRFNKKNRDLLSKVPDPYRFLSAFNGQVHMEFDTKDRLTLVLFVLTNKFRWHPVKGASADTERYIKGLIKRMAKKAVA